MPHELSGGEQQRIANCKSTANKPKVIIADEPTGNLDTGTALDIVALLKEITKERNGSYHVNSQYVDPSKIPRYRVSMRRWRTSRCNF